MIYSTELQAITSVTLNMSAVTWQEIVHGQVNLRATDGSHVEVNYYIKKFEVFPITIK